MIMMEWDKLKFELLLYAYDLLILLFFFLLFFSIMYRVNFNKQKVEYKFDKFQ